MSSPLKYLRGLAPLSVFATSIFFAALETHAAEQRALVIGIGEYQHINKLIGPPLDADKFERFLVRYWGFQSDEIAVLKDGQATKRNILRTMEQWLVNSTQPGDRVVIYYSGHGGQVADQSGDEEDGLDETLVAVDTKADGRLETNQVTDDEVGDILRRLKGRDVTLIVDACHSGTIARSVRPKEYDGEALPRTIFPQRISRDARYDVQAHRREEPFLRAIESTRVWSAAAAYQLSWETGGEGLFTKYFMEGIAEKSADTNRNGVITNAELLNYTRERTKAWCAGTAVCTLGFTPELEATATDLGKSVVPVSATAPTGDGDVGDIIVGGNGAEVRLEILPNSDSRLGDVIRFRVTSGRPGWLILLDINALGEVRQLYPNDISTGAGRDNRIAASRPITVPDAYYGFEFTASPPTGEGTMLAIVTEDDVDLSDLLSSHGDFEPVQGAENYLAQLAERLMGIWDQDDRNRALAWSLARKNYSISE